MTGAVRLSRPDPGDFPPPTLETLPEAVARNVAIAQARTRARIMAVVKADGYGHGACTVAQAAVAAGAEWLGTTDIAEASELRAAGLTVPILTWLNPYGVDAAALTHAALRMSDALGCAGVARMDFFLTDDGPVLNEVNTMPGMTAESQVPRMFAAAGVPYEELVTRLIDAATVPAARPLADEWPKA